MLHSFWLFFLKGDRTSHYIIWSIGLVSKLRGILQTIKADELALEISPSISSAPTSGCQHFFTQSLIGLKQFLLLIFANSINISGRSNEDEWRSSYKFQF